MRILDRYIIRNFLLNYLLALIVLVGMYMLLDLIVNFDRFIKGAKTAGETGAMNLLLDIGDFYGYQTLVIFQQVAGVIPLLAAGFTMVRMTRHNELSAMLASGVSLYRVAAPIVLISIAFSLLAVFDQEVLMPRFQDKLLRKHEEVNRLSASYATRFEFIRDSDSVSYDNLVCFTGYDAGKKRLADIRILSRDKNGVVIRREMADTATWVGPEENPPGGPGSRGVPPGNGYWWLEGNARYIDDRVSDSAGSGGAGVVGSFPYTTGLEPKHVELYLRKRAVDYLSLMQVHELVDHAPAARKADLEKIMHTRVTGPLMNIIMMLLGVPFLLTREPGRLIRNMAVCLVVSGLCFAFTFVCFQMGGTLISPLLGAWIPVLIFGPVSLAMLDAIRT